MAKANNDMLTSEDIKTIESVMNHFEPLTVEEQKLMLFMCVHSMFELFHMKQTSSVQRQIDTYQMFIDLLVKPKFKECGVKEFILGNVKVDYDDLLGLDERRVN